MTDSLLLDPQQGVQDPQDPNDPGGLIAAYHRKRAAAAQASALPDTNDPGGLIASYRMAQAPKGDVDLGGLPAQPIRMAPVVVTAQAPTPTQPVASTTRTLTRARPAAPPIAPPVMAPRDVTQLRRPGETPASDPLAGALRVAGEIAVAPFESAGKAGLYVGQAANDVLDNPTPPASPSMPWIQGTPAPHDITAPTSNEVAASMGVPQISDHDALLSAGQLAALGLGPIAGKLAGRVTGRMLAPLLEKYGPAGLARMDSPTLETALANTVEHGTTGALVGASYDPEHPARGAAIGAALGIAGNEVSAKLARDVRAANPRAAETDASKLLTEETAPSAQATTSVADEGTVAPAAEPDFTVESPADDPGALIAQYRAQQAATATEATPEPAPAPATVAAETAPAQAEAPAPSNSEAAAPAAVTTPAPVADQTESPAASSAATAPTNRRATIEAEIGDVSKPVRFAAPHEGDGYTFIVHKSAKSPGKIQITRMDAHGAPIGDELYDTPTAAAHELARDAGDIIPEAKAPESAPSVSAKQPDSERTAPDLFGETKPKTVEQGSLLGANAGTEASRPLSHAERSAHGELEHLRAIMEHSTDARIRTEAASRISDLEKLVNRDKAISSDEMATRAAAHAPSAETANTPKAIDFRPKATEPLPAHLDTPHIRDLIGRAAAIPETHTIATPEREALRQRVAEQLTQATQFKQRADVVTGLPGSGKTSTVVSRLVAEHGSAELDNDRFKKLAPEWEGGLGANALHRESTRVRSAALDLAIGQGANVVIPTVGNPIDTPHLVQRLQKAGYTVHLHHADVPPQVAAERVLNGFARGDRHFVSPEAILRKGDEPRRAYAAAADLPGVIAHDPIDNAVPRGTPGRPVPDWRREWGLDGDSPAAQGEHPPADGSGPGRRTGDDRSAAPPRGEAGVAGEVVEKGKAAEKTKRPAPRALTRPGQIVDEDGVSRFADARGPSGGRRPVASVSTRGLLQELLDLETKRAAAGDRSIYELRQDPNFHTDGIPQIVSTKTPGGGPSRQAKAQRNLDDLQRITDEVHAELATRMPADDIWPRVEDLRAELDERAGQEGEYDPSRVNRETVSDASGKVLFSRGLPEGSSPRGRKSAASTASESQVPQTQSPAFRRWFGDSKIVDYRGEPRVLYHQTSIEAEQGIQREGFDLGRPGARASDEQVPDGIFLKPTDKDIGLGSADRAQITQVPLYASIQHPLVLLDRDAVARHFAYDATYRDLAAEVRRIDNEIVADYDRRDGAFWAGVKDRNDRALGRAHFDAMDALFQEGRVRIDAAAAKARARLTERLIAEGYDGMVIQEDTGSLGRRTETIIALRPTQVKSATGNRGTFDPKDARISFMEAPTSRATPRAKNASVGAPPEGEQTTSEPTAEQAPTTPAPIAAQSVNRYADAARMLFAPTSRTPQAGVTGRIIREHAADFALKLERAREAMKGFSKSFDKMSPDDRLAFIDRMEMGQDQPTPELTKAAAILRKFLDDTRREVQELGTGKLTQFIENYFPHIWADPDAAKSTIARILGKRPIEGTKSFLKKRTIPTTKEGMEAGLVPVTDNPVDLALLKLREMRRYIAAQRIIAEMKAQGLARYVPAMEKAPDGYSRINDSVAMVYGPPTVEASEAFDKAVREGLEAAITRLGGVTHTRKARLGQKGIPRGALGFAAGDTEIVSKFGSHDGVIMHELGHILDARYDLQRVFGRDVRTVAELKHLADLRLAGVTDPPMKFRDYVQKPEEQVANALHALLHAPEAMESVAPTTKKILTDFLLSHAETKGILDIKPSLTLASGKTEIPVGGLVVLGQHWAPEAVARVLNNYLSPGLRGNAIYDAYQGANNVLNQAQLGLSAFHVGFTSMDAAVSQAAVGLQNLTHGRVLKGIRQIGSYPIAPFTTFVRGSKVLRAYLEPEGKPSELLEMVDAIVAAGGRARQDSFYATGAPKQFMEALRHARHASFPKLRDLAKPSALDDAIKTMGRTSLPAVFELASKLVMEGVVPRQKLGVFAQLAERVLADLPPEATKDETRAALARAWDSVDNRLGQLVYDNLFWDKALKDLAMASVRSVGWNLGTIRELGGGVIDIGKLGTGATRRLLRKPSADAEKQAKLELTERASYAMMLPLVVGLTGGIMTYLLSGERPTELRDYFFPKTGRKNAEGNEERVQLPSYMKDVVAYSKHFVKTIEHKVAPLIGTVSAMLHNEDFYGDQIRNTDDPLVVKVNQEAAYLAKQFIPFGVRNAQEAGKRVTDERMKVGGFIGVTAAPREATRSPAENKLMEYLAGKAPRGSTPEKAALRETRGELLTAAREGTLTDATLDSAVARGDISERQAKTIDKARDPDTNVWVERFKHLSAEEALHVYNLGTTEEQELWRETLEGKLQRAGMDAELEALPPLKPRQVSAR